MKFCIKCGAQLNDNAKFCPKCGAMIASATAGPVKNDPEPVIGQPAEQKAPEAQQKAPAAEQPENRETPVTQQPVQQAAPEAAQPSQPTMTPIPQTKQKSSLPVILGIIAAVVVLAVVGLFAFKKLSGPDITGTWEDAYGLTSFTFNKDGSCSLGALGMSVDGTYTVKDGVITMTIEDMLVQQYPFEINEKDHDKMTLYDPDTGEGTVYHKVAEAQNADAGSAAEPQAGQSQTVAETVTQEAAKTVAETVAETTAAESETTQAAPEKDLFEGLWWVGKTEMTITKSGAGYLADIYVHDSAAGGFGYAMKCIPQGDTLFYTDGTKMQIHCSSQAEEAEIEEYRGLRGSFTLADAVPEDGIAFERDSLGEPKYLIWEKEQPTEKPASSEYICWYSSQCHLEEFDLSFMSREDLRIARNEIYARHGRKFASADLQQHFNSCSWYRGTIEASAFNENMLSQVEKDNVKFIENAENGTPAAAGQEYYFSAIAYDQTGYQNGLDRLEFNGDRLTAEGVINGVYQEMTFQFDGNTKYYSSGGDSPDYEISKSSFFDTLGRMNGLGIYLNVVNGKVATATLCS